MYEIGLAGEIDMAGAIGLVQASGSPSSSYFRLRVRTPTGTTSDARLENRQVILSISSAAEIGRDGESDTLTRLFGALARQGVHPSSIPAVDSRGEDSTAQHGQMVYTVQVVTVPSARNLWREAHSSAQTVVSSDSAAGWLRESIVAKYQKTSPQERVRTILALDAKHAGALAAQEVASTYLARHGDPRTELGFAAIWIVGPTSSSCTQLGTSVWSS